MLNVSKKLFMLTLVVAFFSGYFILTYYKTDIDGMYHFGDVGDVEIVAEGDNFIPTALNILPTVLTIQEGNVGVDKKGEWRHLNEYQISRLSTLGRIMYLGEAPPKTDPNDAYTILVWKNGPFLEKRHIKHWTETRSDPFEFCSVKNCKLTYADEDVGVADAVMFHLHRTKSVKDLPHAERTQRQRWVFLTDESPYHTFLYGSNKLSDYDGIFNWSMTFHMASDVPVPYGRTVTMGEPSLIDLVYGDWTADKKTDVLITTMTSNCGSKNHRLPYVKELQKSIDVDVYGACGPLKCPGHFQSDCGLINQYKFYLAFENSNCPQYITEKLWWNAYAKNAIPIVMGASKIDYEQLLPPHSYINTEDFASPADLARYIKYLNKTSDQFDKYFEWRKNFKVLNEHAYFKTNSFHYCRLCEALNYNNPQPKVYQNFSDFWSRDKCRPSWDENRLQV